MNEGSCVGLDVHARSVVAGVIDVGSGEVRSQRVPPGSEAMVAWLKTLPSPVRVVYEAGPTGYGLARACADVGISCVVAAPSKIRPAADRVKTDRRDAERLARLLRLGEITAVRVPGPDEEAARDLVRAREDARGDLMRARHRLSKLLLRHGAVYDATAWTRAHDAWLRKQRFQGGPLAIVFDECYSRMPARVARPVPRAHPERELKRAASPSGRDHQDRQHARAPAADRSRLASTKRPAVEHHVGTQTHRQIARRASPSGLERAQTARALERARSPRQAALDRRGRSRA